MMHASELLRVQNASKKFGGLHAVKNVSITVKRGEVHGVIGPNGAGKTTLFNLITGLYRADSGRFFLNHKAYFPEQIHRVVRAGIARTFQNIRLFKTMTAIENVMVARHARTKAGIFGALSLNKKTRIEEKETEAAAHYWLDYVGLQSQAAQIAHHLPYGHQRRLEIARALATDPLLLALDEPAAGLNTIEKQDLHDLLEKICDRGISILLIEHDLKLLMGLCHCVTVLDYGEVIAVGDPETIRHDPAVIEAYLGKGAQQ